MQSPDEMALLRTGNLLLDAIPREERESVVAAMQHQTLEPKQILAEPGRPMKRVYFPSGAVISLLTMMSDGSAIETAMVGREGVLGVQVFLGDGTMGNTWAMSQVPGDVLSLGSVEFERMVLASSRLAALLRAYTNALLTQQAQAVGCARLHSLDHRLSTLLLMTQDRAGKDQFPLTQESMSDMLGVHRPSVTLAARTLYEKGLIRYHRGAMIILNRDGLVRAACECYRMITSAIERLIDATATGLPFVPTEAVRIGRA